MEIPLLSVANVEGQARDRRLVARGFLGGVAALAALTGIADYAGLVDVSMPEASVAVEEPVAESSDNDGEEIIMTPELGDGGFDLGRELALPPPEVHPTGGGLMDPAET